MPGTNPMSPCDMAELQRRADALSSQLDTVFCRLDAGELDVVEEYQRVRDALSRALGNLESLGTNG